MLPVILIGLLATASAAPHFPFSDESSLESLLSDETFSMRNFWQNFNREMSTLEAQLNLMSAGLSRIPVTKEGIEGNDYVIEIPLKGFEEGDISVKARPGQLNVVAAHSYGHGSTSNYIIMRTLPDCVGANGDWTYQNGILRIVFPLTKATSSIPEVETVAPNHSREEIEPDTSDNTVNADIGIEKSEPSEENQTPESEGTKYTEGHENDIEFVPVAKY